MPQQVVIKKREWKGNRRQIFPVAEISSRSELAFEPLPIYINSPVWLNLNPRDTLSWKCPSQFHCIVQRGGSPGDQAATLTSGGIIL